LLRCGSKLAECFTADEMTFYVEGVVNGSVRTQEALRRSLGLETQHLPLSSSDRQMRILRPIVFAEPTRPVSVSQS
jgi:hypothetical protein